MFYLFLEPILATSSPTQSGMKPDTLKQSKQNINFSNLYKIILESSANLISTANLGIAVGFPTFTGALLAGTSAQSFGAGTSAQSALQIKSFVFVKILKCI
jgi:hypothetical protein